MRISMSSPDLTDAERLAVAEVLNTSVLSIGPHLEAFEAAFANYTGNRAGIAVNSGTAGLHLCVIAAGVEANDYVVTSPFSFVASANAILYERGVPIFIDVDPATGNIDAALAAEAVEAIANNRPGAIHWLPPSLRDAHGIVPSRLKALLPVHAFGQPADMDPLLAASERYGLTVIEDACEAVGATYKNQQAGAIGNYGVFAFYPNKQMTTGEGGMIVTRDEQAADLFRSLRNQGRDVFDGWLNHTRLGYNYRLDELSAALGLVQIRRIEELLEKRAGVARWYDERLAGLEAIEPPHIVPDTTRMSWFVYVMRVRPPWDRTRIMHGLAEAGIPSRPYFTPIHLQPFYRERFGYSRGAFPVTEYLGDVSLALPFSGVMTQDQVDYVCEHLKRLVERPI